MNQRIGIAGDCFDVGGLGAILEGVELASRFADSTISPQELKGGEKSIFLINQLISSKKKWNTVPECWEA